MPPSQRHSRSRRGANRIDDLGAIAITGAASISNTGNDPNGVRTITTTGPVSAADLQLRVAGNLYLGGPVTIGNTLSVAADSITQSGGSVTAGLLTGTGTFTLDGPGNSIAALGDVYGSRTFTLTNARSLAVTGTLSVPYTITIGVTGDLSLPGTIGNTYSPVVLSATGSITQPASGSIANSLLNLTAQSASLGGANTFYALNSARITNGLSIRNNVGFAIDGPVSASDVTIVVAKQYPSLKVNADVTTPGTLSLTVGDAITQGYGRIAAAALTGSAANATFGSGGNQIATLGSFATTGDLTLANGRTLAVTGPVTGANVTLSVVGDLALAGPVTATATARLLASGILTQTAGIVTAGLLTGSAASAGLGAANQVATLGPFTTAGAFVLTNAQALAVTGPLSAATITLTTTSGPLTLAGPLTATGAVAITSAGPLGQTGGVITAPTLAATGSSIDLGQANQVATLTGLGSDGPVAFTDGRGLAVTGPVTGSSVALATSGDLALSAAIVTPGTLALTSAGAITQPGGVIFASALTGSAASTTLGQAGNQIATLGRFITKTDFTLVDGRSLTVAGPVDPTSVSLTTTGDLAITQTITADTVTLTAGGAITQSRGGAVIAGTLTGRAASATLGGGNQIDTLGPFTTAASLTVVNQTPLRVTGTLTGSTIDLSATRLLTLEGPVFRADRLTLTALPDTGGQGSIQQTGIATITPLDLRTATAQLTLPPGGGTLSLGTLAAGLADLTLTLGSGTAQGALVVNALTVLGSGGGASLTGTVGGRTGADAAIAARHPPLPDPAYTINGCAIGAATCTPIVPPPITPVPPDVPPIVITIPPTVPPTTIVTAPTPVSVPTTTPTIAPPVTNYRVISPPTIFPAPAIASLLRPDLLLMDVLDLTITRDRDDPVLLLPNISDRDY